jgi:hypothetical protein
MPRSAKQRHPSRKMRLYDVHIEGGGTSNDGLRSGYTRDGTSEGYYVVKARSHGDAVRIAKKVHKQTVLGHLQADAEISVHDEGDE